jgi:hypothetical protein
LSPFVSFAFGLLLLAQYHALVVVGCVLFHFLFVLFVFVFVLSVLNVVSFCDRYSGEGLWGVLLMAVAVLPICYLIPGSDGGSYENAVDGFVMIGNNMTLLGLVLLYWLSIAFYNFTSLSVAKSLTTGTSSAPPSSPI